MDVERVLNVLGLGWVDVGGGWVWVNGRLYVEELIYVALLFIDGTVLFRFLMIFSTLLLQ